MTSCAYGMVIFLLDLFFLSFFLSLSLSLLNVSVRCLSVRSFFDIILEYFCQFFVLGVQNTRKRKPHLKIEHQHTPIHTRTHTHTTTTTTTTTTHGTIVVVVVVLARSIDFCRRFCRVAGSDICQIVHNRVPVQWRVLPRSRRFTRRAMCGVGKQK